VLAPRGARIDEERGEAIEIEIGEGVVELHDEEPDLPALARRSLASRFHLLDLGAPSGGAGIVRADARIGAELGLGEREVARLDERGDARLRDRRSASFFDA